MLLRNALSFSSQTRHFRATRAHEAALNATRIGEQDDLGVQVFDLGSCNVET